MQINLKTSLDNKSVVQDLTRKFNLSAENLIARIAFAHSISNGDYLSIEKDLKDSKGKEYKDEVFFGKYKDIYIGIICQHYMIYKTNQDIPKYIKMHVDSGLESLHKLFENNTLYTGQDFLVESIEKGIEHLVQTVQENDAILFDEHTRKSRVKNKELFTSLIEITIGKSKETDKPIVFRLNDTQIHNNHHIAVAGNSGTGKTHFARNLLEQISKKTNNKVNFLFLDFKGLNPEDEKKYQDFFTTTSATLVKAPYHPFPINPLSFIDNINEKNKVMGINKFVDIITKYANLGSVQQQTLKKATRQAFDFKKDGSYPGFNDILQIVEEIEKGKPSSLTEILTSLGEYELFEVNKINPNDLFGKNYYFSLSGDLPHNVRYTSVFLVINYVYNIFMNMDEAPINDNIQSLRYVLLIDEAHNIFKERKSRDLLETMLREIRSKGVSIILLSQGIEEFMQDNFDFSSMCENIFLFDIKSKSNLKMIQKFMGIGEKKMTKYKDLFEKISRFEVLSNLKELEEINIIKLGK
jgi:DNA sulfur modification protein DndE